MNKNTGLATVSAGLLEKYGANLIDEIAAKSEEHSALLFDSEHYEDSSKVYRQYVTARTTIEARRKELKAAPWKECQDIDDAAKLLTARLRPTELLLEQRKAEADKEIEKAREAKKEAERQRVLAAERAQRETEESEMRRVREAEEARLAEIRAEQERIAAEQAAKAAELEAQQKAIEAARVRAEKEAQAKRDAEDKARREQQAREDAERAAKAKAAQDELDRQARELAERQRQIELAEAKKRAEQEAAERIERERIEAEERRVAEEERKAALQRRLDALQPDAVKFANYAEYLTDCASRAMPTVESGEAKLALDVFANKFSMLMIELRVFGK